jgi:hypothetical protein
VAEPSSGTACSDRGRALSRAEGEYDPAKSADSSKSPDVGAMSVRRTKRKLHVAEKCEACLTSLGETQCTILSSLAACLVEHVRLLRQSSTDRSGESVPVECSGPVTLLSSPPQLLAS